MQKKEWILSHSLSRLKDYFFCFSLIFANLYSLPWIARMTSLLSWRLSFSLNSGNTTSPFSLMVCEFSKPIDVVRLRDDLR